MTGHPRKEKRGFAHAVHSAPDSLLSRLGQQLSYVTRMSLLGLKLMEQPAKRAIGRARSSIVIPPSGFLESPYGYGDGSKMIKV